MKWAGEIVELEDKCKGVTRANYLEVASIQAVVAGRLTE